MNISLRWHLKGVFISEMLIIIIIILNQAKIFVFLALEYFSGPWEIKYFGIMTVL